MDVTIKLNEQEQKFLSEILNKLSEPVQVKFSSKEIFEKLEHSVSDQFKKLVIDIEREPTSEFSDIKFLIVKAFNLGIAQSKGIS